MSVFRHTPTLIEYATTIRRAFALGLAFLLLSGSACALDAIKVDDNRSHVSLMNMMQFMEDTGKNLTLDQVRALPEQRFETLTLGNFRRNYSTSVFWLHARLENRHTVPQEWVIHHTLAFTDYVEYWVVVNGTVTGHAIGGDRTLLSERQSPYRFPAIRHVSQPGEVADVYVRVHNVEAAIVRLQFDLNPGREFVRMMSDDQLRLGALYGLPLALALMALIGWGVKRDRRFPLYALYTLSVLGSWLGFNGQLGQYLFVDMPNVANTTLQIFFLLSIIFSSMFSRDFLRTREFLPWADRYFQIMIWASLACVLLRLAGVFTLVTKLSIALLFLDAITPLVGWQAYRRGVSHARWYVIAQLLYSSMIAALVIISMAAPFVTLAFDSFVLAEFAFVGQLLLLSVAQYDRLHLLQRDRVKVERQYQETLESQVAERTMDLEAARDRADQASSSKSEFLANMSHEIRTPINAISGFTALALRTDLNPKQADYLGKIQTATQGLLRIINDLLDFSKIEAGHLEMERIPFRMREVMESTVTYVDALIERKGLELLIHIDPDVPQQCIGDPLRLGQVLINLCSNAVKFTERGEIEISVTVAARSDDTTRLHFAVRDTGIGLTPEQSGKLFQAFTQGDTSTTRKFGGTGLGLAISQRLVGMMQGRIWLESKEGVGTTFFFDAELGNVVGVADIVLPRLPDNLHGQPALVVDDNANARQILTAQLEALGMHPQAVSSGEVALAELRTASQQGRAYPLVLMDWKMPGLDGIAATRAIRSDPDIAGTPVIIMVTAYGREEVMHATQEPGLLDDILLKPISPGLLADILCRPRDRATTEVCNTQTAPRHGRLPGVRVLLVEDNPINQQIASELLEHEGVEVQIAGNGRIALDILNRVGIGYFDVALLDLQMPEMGGYETAQRVRQMPAGEHLPLVAMTAHAMLEERERCLALGMQDHLAKPIDPELMVAKLMQWIGAEALAQAALRTGNRHIEKKAPALSDMAQETFATAPVTLHQSTALPDNLDQLLARFSRALVHVNTGIRTLRSSDSKGPDGDVQNVTPDVSVPEHLKSLLEELKVCLKQNDTRAEEIVAMMVSASGEKVPSWLGEAGAKIDELDYDAALERLKTLPY